MSFHALPHGAGWAVRRSKSTRCIAVGISRTEAWREARVALLREEKALTRVRDTVSSRRRALPMVRVE